MECRHLSGDLGKAYRLAFPDEAIQLTTTQIRRKAANLLSRDRVDERYQYFAGLIAQKLDIREDRILMEVAAIAFADPADLYESDGQTLKNIHQIPAHARVGINKFKTGYTKDGVFTEIAMESKIKALDQLIRIKNMDGENAKNKAPQVRITLNKGDT